MAEPEGWRAKRAEDEENRGTARKKGQEAPHGEASLSEKKEPNGCQDGVKPSPNRARWQSLPGRRTVGSSPDSLLGLARCERAVVPTRGESALAAHGKGSLPRGLAKLRREAHLDALVSHELHTGAPVLSPAPIPPEQRSGTNPERMQQDTDPTRFCGCFPVPLALQTLWAAATIEDPGTVKDAQTAIDFAALLGWAQRLASRTGERPVGLEGEV